MLVPHTLETFVSGSLIGRSCHRWFSLDIFHGGVSTDLWVLLSSYVIMHVFALWFQATICQMFRPKKVHSPKSPSDPLRHKLGLFRSRGWIVHGATCRTFHNLNPSHIWPLCLKEGAFKRALSSGGFGGPSARQRHGVK